GIMRTDGWTGGALHGLLPGTMNSGSANRAGFRSSPMSRSLSKLQAVFLGAVVVAGLALTGAGVFAVGSRQWLWSDTFHVVVGFSQIRGVEVGTRVRVQGIEAGEVETVEPPAEPGGEVMLRLRLGGRLRH